MRYYIPRPTIDFPRVPHMIRPLSGNPKPTMSKAKENPAVPVISEEEYVVPTEINDEPAMDVLTDEIISELTEESKIESDAMETVAKGNPSEEEIKEALDRHDEFISRTYDGVEETIPSELEIFVNGLRVLAKSSPLSSKINRLLDEIESAFRF